MAGSMISPNWVRIASSFSLTVNTQCGQDQQQHQRHGDREVRGASAFSPLAAHPAACALRASAPARGAGPWRRSRATTPGVAALEQLVERQVDHVACRPCAIDHHLARARQHVLDGLDVQALARDFGRPLVGGDQRVEARRLALGDRDDLRPVGLGLLQLARGLALGAGSDVAGVGLRPRSSGARCLRCALLVSRCDGTTASGTCTSVRLTLVTRMPVSYWSSVRWISSRVRVGDLPRAPEHEALLELALADDLADGALADVAHVAPGRLHLEQALRADRAAVLHDAARCRRG